MVKLLTTHTSDEQTDSLADYLPNGPLFVAKKLGSTNLRKLFKGLSSSLIDAEEMINEVSDQYDIRFTENFIDEWEGFVGIPDECFSAVGTLAERRKNVLTKLTALGVQTEANFIALAAVFGATITIEHPDPPIPFPYTFPIVFSLDAKEGRFTLIINFITPKANEFPLIFAFSFGNEDRVILECLFNKLKPANVQLQFKEV